MKSLDDIRARCQLIPAHDSDDGKEHWVFKGAYSRSVARVYAPNFSLDPSGQTLSVQSGMRAVWHLRHRRAMPAGWLAWTRCVVPGCLNPDCITAGTRKAYGRNLVRTGRWVDQPARIVANRINSDRQRKVTRVIAADILGSDESNLALATRHGLNNGTVSRVRRGLKKLPGNPFQGLMP